MNPEHEFEIRIYNPVFKNGPCALMFVTHEVAKDLIEKVDINAGKNEILYFRKSENHAWIALNMKYFQRYICDGKTINLFFS